MERFKIKNPALMYRNYLAFFGLFLPASFVMGFYMYIGTFNRLIADDYCSIYYGRRLGLFRSIWYWYITWHGGFSASAADWFLSYTGPKLLQILTVITLVAWILIISFTLRQLFLRWGFINGSFYYSLLLGVISIYATLVISPDISQSLFWWGGARGYFLPLIFATLYVYAYLKFITSRWKTWQLAVWYLASFSLVFIAGGFAEIFTPVQLVILVGVILWSKVAQKNTIKDVSFRFLFAGLIGALLSFAVMVAAPGNYLRQEFFPDPPNIWKVANISINGYLIFLRSIFGTINLVSIIGSMFVATWIGIVSCTNEGPAKNKLLSAMIAVIVGLILAFGCFPSAAYGVSEPPPLRTQIIPSYLLLLGFTTGGLLLGRWFGVRRHGIYTLRGVVLFFACVFVTISACSETRFLLSIYQAHVSFAQKWDMIDKKIINARESGAEEVYIPPMENWAGLEYPSNRLKYWPNVCFRQYYGIKVLAPPQGD